MKISASDWKHVASKCHTDKLRKDSLNSREWKREAARRFQKTKVKTNKTNKGFK
jgi:hypothetical protein